MILNNNKPYFVTSLIYKISLYTLVADLISCNNNAGNSHKHGVNATSLHNNPLAIKQQEEPIN